jgi:hypothetical protein
VFNYRLLLVIVLVAGSTMRVVAQTSSYTELQAAYIYNFAKYIQWPNEFTQFTIGVLRSEEIAKDFAKILKGKKIAGKPLVIQLVDPEEKLDGLHMLFLPDEASDDLPGLIDHALSKHILTVTEDDLIRKGAGISFVVQDDKLRFKLKKKILDDSGLVASDGLLRLAIIQ